MNMVKAIGIDHILTTPLQDEEVKSILQTESLIDDPYTQPVPYEKWWLRNLRVKLGKIKVPVKVTNSSLDTYPDVPTFEGTLLDISEFGMALKLPSAFARFLNRNEVLHVEFEYLKVSWQNGSLSYCHLNDGRQSKRKAISQGWY